MITKTGRDGRISLYVATHTPMFVAAAVVIGAALLTLLLLPLLLLFRSVSSFWSPLRELVCFSYPHVCALLLFAASESPP